MDRHFPALAMNVKIRNDDNQLVKPLEGIGREKRGV